MSEPTPYAESVAERCQVCGSGPVVAVLAVVGPHGWSEGPQVCERCEDAYFLKVELHRQQRRHNDGSGGDHG